MRIMMKKLYKTLCLTLALSVFVLLLTGCEKKPGLYAWYGGKMDVDTVMTIRVDGGEGEKVYEVPFDTYRAVFLFLKSNVSNFIMNEDSEYTALSTDAEKTAAIKEVAEDILTQYYALVALCEKYDIRITEEDKQAYYEDTEKKIQGYLELLDEDDIDFKGTKEEYATHLYEESLASVGMTPKYYEFNYYRSLLETRLKKIISPDLADYITQSYTHYEQIVFTYTKGDVAAEQKALENILSVQTRLQNGEEMSVIAKDYEDGKVYRDIYFDIYGKTVGAYGDEIGAFTQEAIFALNSDEYSEVMAGDQDDYVGYFVILHKLDIDMDYICSSDAMAKFMYQYSYVDATSYSICYSKYNKLLETYIQNTSLTPVSEKVYKRISIKTLY